MESSRDIADRAERLENAVERILYALDNRDADSFEGLFRELVDYTASTLKLLRYLAADVAIMQAAQEPRELSATVAQTTNITQNKRMCDGCHEKTYTRFLGTTVVCASCGFPK